VVRNSVRVGARYVGMSRTETVDVPTYPVFH